MKTSRSSRSRKQLRTFLRNKTSLAGAIVTIAVISIAVVGPVLAPHDDLIQDVFNRFAPPSFEYPLGTDDYGRDVFSRVLMGLRVSLTVGLLATALGMIVGTALGIVAGFYREIVGEVIMRSMDVMMSFPGEVLGVVIVIALGTGLPEMVITIGFLLVPRFARLAYIPTLAVREESYVVAGKALGMRDARIIVMHVLPNIVGEIVVMSTLWIGTAIRLEANLSFLGLGIPPPTPTLGNMVKDGVDRLAYAPWISLSAGVAIMIIILGVNTLGDGLRDVSDPKLRS